MNTEDHEFINGLCNLAGAIAYLKKNKKPMNSGTFKNWFQQIGWSDQIGYMRIYKKSDLDKIIKGVVKYGEWKAEDHRKKIKSNKDRKNN